MRVQSGAFVCAAPAPEASPSTARRGKTARTWCKGNERTRVKGISCTKSAPTPEEKWPGTWCKGNEGTRVRGLTCTKPAPAPEEKWPETWCKGNEGTRVRGLSCTKSAPVPEEKQPGTWCKGNEGTRVRGLSCTKSAPASGPIAPGRRPVTSPKAQPPPALPRRPHTSADSPTGRPPSAPLNR